MWRVCDLKNNKYIQISLSGSYFFFLYCLFGRLQNKDVRFDRPNVTRAAAEHVSNLEMKNGIPDN